MPIGFREHIQGFELGNLVEIYQIDLTRYGLGVLRYFKGEEGAAPIQWDGEDYTSIPIQSTGWEQAADGSEARPNFAMANISGIFTALLAANNNWKGGIVRRIVTYQNFLDGEADEDPTAHNPVDEYVINRKLADEGGWAAFELVSALDMDGVYIPGRTANRDYCDHSYRTYNTTTNEFDYTNVTCLWGRKEGTGTEEQGYFNEMDEEVEDPADDNCGRRCGSCKLRFGEFAELPFGGFVGLARTRNAS